jgi:hypothetical protein
MTISDLDEDDKEHSKTTDEPTDRSGHSGETARGDPENGERLPYDVVFGLLANERRRRTLTYLTESENPTTLSNLAEHIASLETGKPVRALSSSERKRVYVGLYQCHLPKMDDANVIDYNQSRGTIEIRPEADQLLCYLPDDPEETALTETRFQVPIPTSLLALGARLREQIPI